ncbi:vanillate O-demethylase ferredoxin subunit [Glutamicibacter mysorens]|uniref:Vanillate O-demethylase ferredoxin subunit n=1 Tax=Glutamicibacter mysorens TaxID=257984 RepID=A0ABX4N0M6_9MICC|nr:PDR/VanB family oxidoreductase [Glutamicibacter mysorens]PJJ45178.1 vanillate O-demethylase ferredoxin subunit [Glutamicibacter mysorens]
MSLRVRVEEVTEEGPGIRSLRLVREDGKDFTPYQAGAHIDVIGPTGVLRQYSLCSPPEDPSSLMIAVKREADSRGGSVALHEVQAGDFLKIGKPRNLLAIASTADKHLLVAGGIGVTPLLSMAYQLHSRGEDFELHYFARSRSEMSFADLLENRAEFRSRVVLHVGVPRAAQAELLASLTDALSEASHVYTCGPAGFMDQVVQVFAPSVGSENVHLEHFEAAEVETYGDSAFVVELDTGESFDVPADRSILAVLEDNGIDVFKSCEEGICGSCVSGLLEGEPEHRDNCLSKADKAAGNQIALCVSRARSEKLVIELY